MNDAMYQYKQEREPGYIFLDIPMQANAMDHPGFADFVEQLTNFGSSPNVGKYNGHL